MKSKILIIILIILVVVCSFFSVIGYIKHNKNNEDKNKTTIINEVLKNETITKEDYYIKGKDRRNIYYCYRDNSIVFINYNDSSRGSFFDESLCKNFEIKEIETDSVDREVWNTLDNYFFYKDNSGLYVYNIISNEKKNININNLFNSKFLDTFDLSSNSDIKSTPPNIIFQDGDEIVYYNFADDVYDIVKVPNGMKLNEDYPEYEFLIQDNKIIGYIYGAYENEKYYSFDTKKMLYTNYCGFSYILINNKIYLTGRILEYVDDEGYFAKEISILDPNKENVYLNEKLIKNESKLTKDIKISLTSTAVGFSFDGKYISLISSQTDNSILYQEKYYKSDFTELAPDSIYLTLYNDKVYSLNDNYFKEIDENGTVVKSINLEYKKIYNVVPKTSYIIVLNYEDEILLVDINGNEIKLDKLDSNYEYNLATINEENNIDVAFLNDKKCVIKEYLYNLKTKKIEKSSHKTDWCYKHQTINEILK